ETCVGIQIEPISRMSGERNLRPLVGRAEIAQVLSRVRGDENEEIAVFGLGVEHIRVERQPPVQKLALESHFVGIGNFSLEQIVHAEYAVRARDFAHTGLVEAAAAKSTAPAAVEGP